MNNWVKMSGEVCPSRNSFPDLYLPHLLPARLTFSLKVRMNLTVSHFRPCRGRCCGECPQEAHVGHLPGQLCIGTDNWRNHKRSTRSKRKHRGRRRGELAPQLEVQQSCPQNTPATWLLSLRTGHEAADWSLKQYSALLWLKRCGRRMF